MRQKVSLWLKSRSEWGEKVECSVVGSEKSSRRDTVPDVRTPGRSHGDAIGERMQPGCGIGHHPLVQQLKMGERDNCELSVNVLKKHGG